MTSLVEPSALKVKTKAALADLSTVERGLSYAQTRGLTDDDPVSPELALVDPQLRLRLAATPEVFQQSRIRPRAAPPVEPHRAIARQRAAPLAAAVGGALVAVAALFALGALKSPGVDPSSARTTVTTASPAATVATVAPAVKNAVRTFAWAPVAGADSYEVALYLRSRRVFHARTQTESAAIRLGSLKSGVYEWYVWPVRHGVRDRVAVVRSQLKISSASG